MTINAKNLSAAVRKSQALINSHIGSNGNAHLTATQDTAGFMSPDDKFQLDSKGNYARGLDASTSTMDILQLPFGFFYGRSFVNAPVGVDNSICLVSISGTSIYKHIEFHFSAAGKNYIRDIAGSNDTGWLNDSWVSWTPGSAFSGNLRGTQKPTISGGIIQILFDLTCSITSSSLQLITTLPSGYYPRDAQSEPIYQPCRVSYDDGTNGTGGFAILSGGNSLNFARGDSSYASTKTIKGISGFLVFAR